jgi:hypothetical protein
MPVLWLVLMDVQAVVAHIWTLASLLVEEDVLSLILEE